MFINADFSRRAVVTAAQYQWIASPQAGVERVMLERIGGEKARATSVVRYAPNATFPHHQHPAGEEILVLAGAFDDGEARYPAGWYLRNPPGSAHQPGSVEGAILFVKLRQMRADETLPVRIDTNDASRWRQHGTRMTCALFSNDVECVSLEWLPPLATLSDGQRKGLELLVLTGTLLMDGQRHARGSWLRLPPGDAGAVVAGEHGVTVYLKTSRAMVPTGVAMEVARAC